MSGDISSPNSTFQGRKAAHTPVKLSTEFILNESLMLGSIIVSCMTLCLRCTKTNYGIKLLTWPVVWEMYLLWQHLSVKALTARINKDGRIILFRSLVKVQTRRKHTHTHAYTLPQRWRNTRTNSSPRRSRAGGWKMSLWREGESQRWKSLAVIAGLCFPGVCVCVCSLCFCICECVCPRQPQSYRVRPAGLRGLGAQRCPGSRGQRWADLEDRAEDRSSFHMGRDKTNPALCCIALNPVHCT